MVNVHCLNNIASVGLDLFQMTTIWRVLMKMHRQFL